MSDLVLLLRDSAGVEVVFKPGGVFRIGRHAGNNLVVDHPTVSKFHLRLTWARDEDSPQLHDEGSHNGTFLDGERLRSAAHLPLTGVADLRVGDIVLQAEVASANRPVEDSTSGGFSLFSDDGPEISGELEGDGALPDLLRSLELNKRTGTLKLDLPSAGPSALTFYLGKVMGAESRQLRGIPAFRRIMEDPRGGFRFVRRFQPQAEPLGFWPSDLMRQLP